MNAEQITAARHRRSELCGLLLTAELKLDAEEKEALAHVREAFARQRASLDESAAALQLRELEDKMPDCDLDTPAGSWRCTCYKPKNWGVFIGNTLYVRVQATVHAHMGTHLRATGITAERALGEAAGSVTLLRAAADANGKSLEDRLLHLLNEDPEQQLYRITFQAVQNGAPDMYVAQDTILYVQHTRV
jgi:hypothetical protein